MKKIKTTRAIPKAKPVRTLGLTKIQVVPKIRIIIDLNQLIIKGYVSAIGTSIYNGIFSARIVLSNNNIELIGYGKTMIESIEDLNQKIIDANFEI